MLPLKRKAKPKKNKNVEKMVKTIIAQHMGSEVGRIQDEADLTKNLRMDSLVMGELCGDLAVKFSVKFDLNDLLQAKTVGGIIELISKKKSIKMIVARHAGCEANLIKEKTDFIKDLNMDSLAIGELCGDLAVKFSVKLTPNDLLQAQTVGGVIQLIKNKKGGKP